MRYAIDFVDESGNDRIYIGVPLEMTGGKMVLRMRNGDTQLDIARITAWHPVDDRPPAANLTHPTRRR